MTLRSLFAEFLRLRKPKPRGVLVSRIKFRDGINAMNGVWQRGPQDSTQRFLLLALADAVNEKRGDSLCWPGIEALMQKTAMSKSTVLRTIQALELGGWIVTKKKAIMGRGTIYDVQLSKLGLGCQIDTCQVSNCDEPGVTQTLVRCQDDAHQVSNCDLSGVIYDACSSSLSPINERGSLAKPDSIIRKEPEITRKEPELLAESSVPETPAETVFDLPLVDGSNYGLPESLFGEYVKAYPAVSVMEQLGAMRTWLLSNPKNRKTRSGIARFMNGWLSKAQNQAPRDAGTVINGNTVNRAQQRTNGNLAALAAAMASRSTSPAALGLNTDPCNWDDAVEVAKIRQRQAAGEKVGPASAEFAARWERNQQRLQIESQSRAAL